MGRRLGWETLTTSSPGDRDPRGWLCPIHLCQMVCSLLSCQRSLEDQLNSMCPSAQRGGKTEETHSALHSSTTRVHDSRDIPSKHLPRLQPLGWEAAFGMGSSLPSCLCTAPRTEAALGHASRAWFCSVMRTHTPTRQHPR